MTIDVMFFKNNGNGQSNRVGGGYITVGGATLPILVGSVVIAAGGVMFWLLFKPGRDDKFAAPSGAEVQV